MNSIDHNTISRRRSCGIRVITVPMLIATFTLKLLVCYEDPSPQNISLYILCFLHSYVAHNSLNFSCSSNTQLILGSCNKNYDIYRPSIRVCKLTLIQLWNRTLLVKIWEKFYFISTCWILTKRRPPVKPKGSFSVIYQHAVYNIPNLLKIWIASILNFRFHDFYKTYLSLL